MEKIKYLNNNNLVETEGLQQIKIKSALLDLKIKKRDNLRKDDIHKQQIRDSNTNHVFKIINQCILIISKLTALIFTIFLVCLSINNYINHIPIQNELKAALPISAAFITDIPNDIIKYFRKSPP